MEKKFLFLLHFYGRLFLLPGGYTPLAGLLFSGGPLASSALLPVRETPSRPRAQVEAPVKTPLSTVSLTNAKGDSVTVHPLQFRKI